MSAALQLVFLDLLVQVAPRHIELARCLAHVPPILRQLGLEECPLSSLLEILERLAAHQVANGRVARRTGKAAHIRGSNGLTR